MLNICFRQMKNWIISPRFYISIFIGIAAFLLDANNLLDFSTYLKEPLNIFDGFIYSSCNRSIIVFAFLGLLFFLSDIPFEETSEIYTLLRCSRRKWVAGKILYIFISCFTYYFIILTADILYVSCNAFAFNIWSDPMYTLSISKPDIGLYNLYFPYSEILHNFNPLTALISSFGLNVLYSFSLTLFLFWMNLITKNAIGFAAVIMVHATGYLLCTNDYLRNFRLSLFCHSLLEFHYFSNLFGSARYAGMFESLILFLLVSTFLIILISKAVKNYDFKISVSAKI